MPYTSKTGKDRQNNICISWAKWTTRLKYHRKQSNIYWDWKCSKKQSWAPVRCVWFVASNVLEYSVLKINNQNQNAMEKLPDRVTEVTGGAFASKNGFLVFPNCEQNWKLVDWFRNDILLRTWLLFTKSVIKPLHIIYWHILNILTISVLTKSR